MTIVVLRQPQLLEDWHFTPVTTLVDLADGRRLRACTTPVEPGMAVVIDGVRP